MPVIKMAVKTKEKAKQKVDVAVAKVKAVEDYAIACAELALLKTVTEGLEATKQKALKVLEPELADQPAAETVLIVGEKHVLKFSPKQWVREILGGTEAVKETVGDDLFMKIAKVGLGEIDKYVDDKTKVKFIKSERTGRRAVEVIPNKK